MSADLTVHELPEWFKEHDARLTQVEAELTELRPLRSELKFLKNLWLLRAFAVPLPRNAARDPRVLPRPRQGGHL